MDEALSRALVALPGWPDAHRPPSWYGGADRTFRQPDGMLWRQAPGTESAGWLPDLDDPATGGVLLGMLAAAVPGHEVSAAFWPIPVPGGDWHVFVLDWHCDGPTLAHACAEALVAVGRCG